MFKQESKSFKILMCCMIGLFLIPLVFGLLNATVHQSTTLMQGSGHPIVDAIYDETIDTPKLMSVIQSNPETVDAPDLMGYYPIHRAVIMEKEPVIRLLIKLGADINRRADTHGQIPGPYTFENTPLHVAVSLDDVSATRVSLLLNLGADPRLSNSEGDTPVDLAKQRGLTEIVSLLEGGSATEDQRLTTPPSP